MGFILATPTSDRYRRIPYNAKSLEKFPLSDAYIENMYIDTNGSRRYVQEYIPSAQTSNFLGGLGIIDPVTAVTVGMFALKLLRGKPTPAVKIEKMSEWDNQVLKKGTPPTQQGKFMIWSGSVPATHVKVHLIFSLSLLRTINTWDKWKTFKQKLIKKGGWKESLINKMFQVIKRPRWWASTSHTILKMKPCLVDKNYMSKGIMSRGIDIGWSGGKRYDPQFKAIHIKPPEAPIVAPAESMPMGAPRNGFDMKLLLIPAGVVFVGGLAYLLLAK